MSDTEKILDVEEKKDDDIVEMSVEELEKSEENKNRKSRLELKEEKAKARDEKRALKRTQKSWISKHKGWIIFLIIVLAIIIFMMYAKKKTQEAIEQLTGTHQEIDLIEKSDISSTISTTGTIVAKETNKVMATARDSKIINVNFKVGDIVRAGDVLVTFSVENINRNIANLEEDISESRKREVLEAENRNRTYMYTYGSEASSLASAEERVDYALKALYEACDGYGNAKRALQAKENGEEGTEYQSIEVLRQNVSAAYQQEQTAQKNYSDAVAALDEANRRAVNDLASADNSYATGELTAGDATRNLQRQLETYQRNLEDYIIIAPISGIVTNVGVKEGSYFGGGEIMTIQNIDSYVVTTEIDEYYIPDVKLGQKVVIKTDATGDEVLKGVVSDIAPIATATVAQNAADIVAGNVTYTVKIDVNTDNPRIKLGMSAKLNIITDEHEQTLVVRYDAINTDENGNNFIQVVDASNSNGAEQISDSHKNVNGIEVVGSVEADEDDKSSLKGFNPFKKKEQEEEPKLVTRDVPVTLGIEGPYYMEIFGEGIEEGMQVVVEKDNIQVTSMEELMRMSVGD